MVAQLEISESDYEPIFKLKPYKHALKIVFLILTGLVATVQLAVFDYYIALYGEEYVEQYFSMYSGLKNCSEMAALQKQNHSFLHLYYCIPADILVLGAIGCLIVIAARNWREVSGGNVSQARLGKEPGLAWAWLVWLIYTAVLTMKIATTRESFLKILQYFEICKLYKALSINGFLLVLTSPAMVFVLMILAYKQVHDVKLRSWLPLLQGVTLNILDAVQFLQILLTQNSIYIMHANPGLETSIISFACINLMLPSVYMLTYAFKTPEENEAKGKRERAVIKYIDEGLYTLLLLILVNIPYLVIRMFLWYKIRLEISIFLVKNAISILLGGYKTIKTTYALVNSC